MYTEKRKRVKLTLKGSPALVARITSFWSHFQRGVILTPLKLESVHHDSVSKRVKLILLLLKRSQWFFDSVLKGVTVYLALFHIESMFTDSD